MLANALKLLLLSAIASPMASAALGLGEIKLKSTQYQPFRRRDCSH